MSKDNIMKKSKRNNIISKLLESISDEEKEKFRKETNQIMDYYDERPDYNKCYGTDKSYFLKEQVVSNGFNPVGITIMTCEETFIMETKEEVDAAWDKLKYEGWWYTIDEWKNVRDKYVKDMYNGDYEKAPKVYCLNKKYKDRL